MTVENPDRHTLFESHTLRADGTTVTYPPDGKCRTCGGNIADYVTIAEGNPAPLADMNAAIEPAQYREMWLPCGHPPD